MTRAGTPATTVWGDVPRDDGTCRNDASRADANARQQERLCAHPNMVLDLNRGRHAGIEVLLQVTPGPWIGMREDGYPGRQRDMAPQGDSVREIEQNVRPEVTGRPDLEVAQASRIEMRELQVAAEDRFVGDRQPMRCETKMSHWLGNKRKLP